MSIANPYMVPGLTPDGVTVNPTQLQLGDGTQGVMSFDRQGAQLTNTLRGKYGSYAHRGGVFMAANTTAAGTIAVNTTTSSSTFVFYNPVGNSVVAELGRFNMNFLLTNAAPSTANIVGFNMINLTSNAISAITKIPDPVSAGGHAVLLGGPAPQCSVATVATFAIAQTVAANWGIPMFSFPASWVPTVGGWPVPLVYDFDGSVLVPPGWALALVASTAWGATTVASSLTWGEYRQ